MAAAVNCCNAASWYVLWKTLEKIWYIIYYVGLYFISNLYNVHYTNAVRKPSDHTHTTFSYSVTACAKLYVASQFLNGHPHSKLGNFLHYLSKEQFFKQKN